jgi:hypothetical protein
MRPEPVEGAVFDELRPHTAARRSGQVSALHDAGLEVNHVDYLSEVEPSTARAAEPGIRLDL